MAFRIKDLIINHASAADSIIWAVTTCHFFSAQRLPGPPGCPDPAIPDPGFPDIDALKQHLRTMLSQLEEHEKEILASQVPRTVAEIDELKAKLLEAVEELEKQKRDLR